MLHYETVEPDTLELLRRLMADEIRRYSWKRKKKDFYDLYFLLEKMTLQEMLSLHYEKFKLSTIFHIVKSLTYFEDAENDDPPVLIKRQVTWPQVKKKMLAAVASL